MAVSTAALKLSDYAVMSKDPAASALMFSLIQNRSVLEDIPIMTKKALMAAGVRWVDNLPAPTWADINEEGTTVTGKPTDFIEQAYIIRNYIDTDHLLMEDENQLFDPHAARIEAYMKGLTYEINNKFINNEHLTANGDNKAPVGIRSRIANGTTYGVRSENLIDAGAAVITTAATAAQFGALCNWIDQALWSVGSPDGDNVVLYCNELLMRRFDFLARVYSGQGGFGQATDQFGRTVTKYKNAQIKDIGYKSDQSTRIITVTESSTGLADTGSTHTSLYAVNYGPGAMTAWQMAPISPKPVDQDNGVIKRTLIEWTIGLYSQSNRSIARVFGLKYS